MSKKQEQYNHQVDQQVQNQNQYPFNSIEEAEESLEQTPSIKLKSTLLFRNLDNQQAQQTSSIEINQFNQNPKFSNFHKFQSNNKNKLFDLNKVFEQIQTEKKEKSLQNNMNNIQYKERLQKSKNPQIQEPQNEYQNNYQDSPQKQNSQDFQQYNQNSPQIENLKNSDQQQKILFRQVESPIFEKKNSQKESQVIDRFRNDKNILEQMQSFNQLQKSGVDKNLSEFDINNMEQQAQYIEELNFKPEKKSNQNYYTNNLINKQSGDYQIFDIYQQDKQIQNFKEVEKSLQSVKELMNSNMAFSQIQQNSQILNQQNNVQQPIQQHFQAKKIYTSLEQYKQPQIDQNSDYFEDQSIKKDSFVENIQKTTQKQSVQQSQRNSQIDFNKNKHNNQSNFKQNNDQKRQISQKNLAYPVKKELEQIEKKHFSWIHLSVNDRNQMWTVYKKQNLQILKDQSLCQEKIKCTFNPQTNTSKNFSSKKLNFLNGVNYKIECYNSNDKYNDKNFHNQVRQINSYQQLHEFKKINGFENVSQNQSSLRKSIENSVEQLNRYGTTEKKCTRRPYF